MSKSKNKKVKALHTKDVKVGDRVEIAFPFASRGWIRYGKKGTFTISQKDGDAIQIEDKSGRKMLKKPVSGTMKEISDLLKEETRFTSLAVYRPKKGKKDAATA